MKAVSDLWEVVLFFDTATDRADALEEREAAFGLVTEAFGKLPRDRLEGEVFSGILYFEYRKREK